jgi:hypothetical protein
VLFFEKIDIKYRVEYQLGMLVAGDSFHVVANTSHYEEYGEKRCNLLGCLKKKYARCCTRYVMNIITLFGFPKDRKEIKNQPHNRLTV